MLQNKYVRFLLLTVSTIISSVGIYVFRFPNNFSFGGITGLAIAMQPFVPMSVSTINLILSIVLLVVGYIFMGKSFGLLTAYSSMLFSFTLSAMERFVPLSQPLTNQPMLELCYAIVVPGVASAVIFFLGASSGGTDVLAMMLKKYTSVNIGVALFFVDLLIVAVSCFVFDIQTVLYSIMGLMAKSLVVDNIIESITLCKYFNIICDKPEIICEFITSKLNKGATVCDAEGAFSHNKKHIIFTVLSRQQAVSLRKFVKQVEPDAFILITNTSEIIGRGFQN